MPIPTIRPGGSPASTSTDGMTQPSVYQNAGQSQQNAQWQNAPVTASGKGARGNAPRFNSNGTGSFTPPVDRSGVVPVVRRPPFQSPVITNTAPPPGPQVLGTEDPFWLTHRRSEFDEYGRPFAPGAGDGNSASANSGAVGGAGGVGGIGSDASGGGSSTGFRKGGTVKDTGKSLVHKGEEVITSKEAGKPGVRGALKDINKPGVGKIEKQIKKVRPFNR